MEGGLDVPEYGHYSFTTYESNLMFELRYMIDTDMVGAMWIELPPCRYSIRPPIGMTSHCQMEVDIVYNQVIVHPPDDDWSRNAPLRICSFDIECK